jgi:hypothetical protein
MIFYLKKNLAAELRQFYYQLRVMLVDVENALTKVSTADHLVDDQKPEPLSQTIDKENGSKPNNNANETISEQDRLNNSRPFP